MLVRMAMAIEAPAHAEGLTLGDDLLAVDITVATGAANSSFQMNAMVEIGVFRQLVDADPIDRLASFIAFADWGKRLAVLFD